MSVKTKIQFNSILDSNGKDGELSSAKSAEGSLSAQQPEEELSVPASNGDDPKGCCKVRVPEAYVRRILAFISFLLVAYSVEQKIINLRIQLHYLSYIHLIH